MRLFFTSLVLLLALAEASVAGHSADRLICNSRVGCIVVAVGDCVRGSWPNVKEYPCTAVQERAQNRWFAASSKCWRGVNPPALRAKCFGKIEPSWKDRP